MKTKKPLKLSVSCLIGHMLGVDFAMVNDCPFLVSSALEDVHQFCAM